MTLELTQIAPQVTQMGQTAARQTADKQIALQQAREYLTVFANAFAQLKTRIAEAEKVQQSVRFSWLGAAPTTEPLTATFPPPPPPPTATVIAADGSQIHPDQHALALYYLINAGAIVYRHGSGTLPTTHTASRLFYRDEDLLTEQGLLVSTGMVNVKRDVAEVQILADLADQFAVPNTPLITLMDGQFTLRVIDLPAQEQEFYQTIYLQHLHRLQQAEATIAAYIDRPRSSFVLALLHLAALEPEAITEETLKYNPFFGLTDIQLFADLPPGHRTALFNQRAKGNVAYAKAGHTIHFFYLNTGTTQTPNLARVEIPGWVAADPARLNTLHAILLKQAVITGGYPYVLARAHELAIISPAERESLETMLALSLRKNGIYTGVSLKQANKNFLKNS